MAVPPPPRLLAFVVERPSPLAPPTVAPPAPPQALLEAVAALDAESRGEQGAGSSSVSEFLSRALGGGARRADVFVATCGCCSSDEADANSSCCCGFLVARRIGPLAARVSALGVRPSCRRKGLATALMQRACAQQAAAPTGRGRPEGTAATVVLVTLAVARGNNAARALYEKLGFAPKDPSSAAGGACDDEDIEMEAKFDVSGGD